MGHPRQLRETALNPFPSLFLDVRLSSVIISSLIEELNIPLLLFSFILSHFLLAAFDLWWNVFSRSVGINIRVYCALYEDQRWRNCLGATECIVLTELSSARVPGGCSDAMTGDESNPFVGLGLVRA